jgi:hypothetical protein
VKNGGDDNLRQVLARPLACDFHHRTWQYLDFALNPFGQSPLGRFEVMACLQP